MDLVDPILAVAEKLYSLCGEVKANKKRCERLTQRIKALMGLVTGLKAQGLGGSPKLVQQGLQMLKRTLDSSQDVVKKYTSAHCLKRIVRAYDLGEEFGTLNEQLNDAAQLLMLALHADQRQKLASMFEEAMCKREDDADRENDRKELEKLLLSMAESTKENVDAVHKLVDSTNKDVQDIKVLLESLKKPSIHLLDIREIKPEELTFEVPMTPIMESCNSEVFKGEFNRFTVAIKRYTCPTRPEQVREIFQKEVETMKRFESPNILRMFGICVQDENGPNPNYLIVTEFCEKGRLREVLDGKAKLSWERRARMSLDAAHGVYRLHQSEEKFKVHGCITSSKFLVDSGYRVKLGGFELAKTEISLKNKRKERKNSAIKYSSPQQLESISHTYDRPSEIYSFGIVLWEIATRKMPFEDCSSCKEVYEKVCVKKAMEPLPEDCPRGLADLINASRSYNPFYRPKAGGLVDELLKVVQALDED